MFYEHNNLLRKPINYFLSKKYLDSDQNFNNKTYFLTSTQDVTKKITTLFFFFIKTTFHSGGQIVGFVSSTAAATNFILIFIFRRHYGSCKKIFFKWTVH